MIPDDQYNMFLTIWGHFGPNLAYKKILGKFTKVLGFGKTPPHVGKISQIISFFLFESVPKKTLASISTTYEHEEFPHNFHRHRFSTKVTSQLRALEP